MSHITDLVIKDLERRSDVGFKKYGTTMDRTDLSSIEWLQHLYEELLDAAQYTKKLMVEVDSSNIENAYGNAVSIRNIVDSAFRKGSFENKTYADEEFNKDSLAYIGVLASKIVEDLYGEIK